MKSLRREVDEIEMSEQSLEEHRINTQIQEELSKEDELLEKEFEAWKKHRDVILNSPGLTRTRKRKLDSESRKYSKKLSKMAERLEFLAIKNKKEILEEVRRNGQING